MVTVLLVLVARGIKPKVSTLASPRPRCAYLNAQSQDSALGLSSGLKSLLKNSQTLVSYTR